MTQSQFNCPNNCTLAVGEGTAVGEETANIAALRDSTVRVSMGKHPLCGASIVRASMGSGAAKIGNTVKSILAAR